MASSRQCFKCSKSSASINCAGCDKYFCNRCFKEHRERMFGEMDKIVESRNQIQEAINHLLERSDKQSPLISEIDRWEKKTIRRVREVAAQAREQTLQLLNTNQAKIHSGFKNFSQELAALRESEDFVEPDLARLNQMIGQFKLDINQSTQPTTIKLHKEQSDKVNWDSLIYVEEIRTRNNQERQRQMNGLWRVRYWSCLIDAGSRNKILRNGVYIVWFFMGWAKSVFWRLGVTNFA